MFGGALRQRSLALLPLVAVGVAVTVGLMGGLPPHSGAGGSVVALGLGVPAPADASNTTAVLVPDSLVVAGVGLLIAIAFTSGYFIIPRGGVDEVFLVHDSGLLLVHFSKTLRPTKDRDVLVGMLTAVQTFVQDAFTKGPLTGLREMDMGDRKLLICKGAYGYLAVIVRGRAPIGMARRMRTALTEVEGRYRAAIASWDGSTDALSGADDILVANLLTGWLRHLEKRIVSGFAWLRSLIRPRPAEASAPAKPAHPQGIQVDPRETARALLRRPELQSFRPEYRDMMATALQQIEEGRFSLTGLANIYMVMALQKSTRANVVGWWNLVLRTIREVLWLWPWTPPSQAWVMDLKAEPATLPPEAEPMPIEVPHAIPAESPSGIPAGSAHPAVHAKSLDSP